MSLRKVESYLYHWDRHGLASILDPGRSFLRNAHVAPAGRDGAAVSLPIAMPFSILNGLSWEKRVHFPQLLFSSPRLSQIVVRRKTWRRGRNI